MIKRLFNKLKNKKQPRFIFSYRYFIPNLTGPLRLHRKLFFLSLKNPLHLIFNLYAYCYWILITIWISSYKASVMNYQKIDKNPVFLFFSLVKLGLIHNIAPRYYFKYALYQTKNKKQALTYFYNNQLSYFHDYTNKPFPHYKKAKQLIHHKQRFAEALRHLNIPSVSGKIFHTKQLQSNSSLLFSKQTVFCKPPHGSRSVDAFLIAYNPHNMQYTIKPIKQPDIQTPQAIRLYLKQIFSRHKTFLVQAFIADHPEIQALSLQEASTTIRIITTKLNNKANLLYIQLEVPKPKQTFQTYLIYPLTLDTFNISPIFKTNNPGKIYPYITETIKQEIRKAVLYCIKAHEALLDLNSVSFDVILSKKGPVILEANYHWPIELLYHIIDKETAASNPAKAWLNQIISRK